MTNLSSDSFNFDALLEADLQLLSAPVDVHDVDILPGRSQVCVDVKGGPSFEFLEEDETFMKLVAQGGSNPSAAVDKWAINRLNKYRSFKGLNADVKIKDMPEGECSKLLTHFFAQVKKKNGQLYPTQTLSGLYRAFDRVLRRAQEVRIQRTGINEAPFVMRKSPIFKSVETACVMSMGRSRSAGANLPRKKSSIISLADECTILSHSCTSPVHPRGLQARSIYYLLCRFAIRGGQELYNLEKQEFQFDVDEGGRYIRYDERLSKNYRVSLDRYQEEHFRPAVTSHDLDMVLMIESLISHLPTSGTFLFYQVIDSPRRHAWFSTLRISAKKLTGVMRVLHEECGLVADSVTNKSGRTTCVSRMACEGVPAPVGMRITGHKSQGAYSRYDRSVETHVRAAQKCAGEGSSYSSNVEAETSLFKSKVVGGDASHGGTAKKLKYDPAIQNAHPERVADGVELMSSTDAISTTGVEPLVNPQVTVAVADPVRMDVVMALGAAIAVPPVNVEGSQEIPSADADEWKPDEWEDVVNWDQVMNGHDRVTNVNPISAIFGRIATMAHCTLNVTIGNFHSN